MRFAPLDAAILQGLLRTQTCGRTLHILDQTPSTNDEAKTLAAQGAPEGTVVLAEQQTQGRGRQGRTFVSPVGVGVYLSLLLRPSVETPRLPPLTLLVAVAAAEAIAEVTSLPVGLKWPNDVEIHGKKIAGILTEAVMHVGQPPAVIIGIGINVNTTMEQFPASLYHRVTSLALATGYPVDRHQLIAALLAHGERLYQVFQQTGLAPILARWQHHGRITGRRVRVSQATAKAEGIVVGLDEDGALLVHTGSSEPQRVLSGDVTFV
ncbi:Bifunctional ligase/repressor BirA [Candidatus Entotheonellaceae bacterium PAL068K]